MICVSYIEYSLSSDLYHATYNFDLFGTLLLPSFATLFRVSYFVQSSTFSFYPFQL